MAMILCLSACSDQPADSGGAVNTPGSSFDEIATPDVTTTESEPDDTNLALEPFVPSEAGSATESGTTNPATVIEIVPETEVPTGDEPDVEARKTPEGRWEMVVHVFEFDLIALLVDITNSGDGYAAEAVGESVTGWILNEATITDDTVHLKITDPQAVEIDYRGTFEDGVIRGNIAFSEQGLDLASLRPTQREVVEVEEARQPPAGFDQIASLQPDENLLDNLRSIAQGLGPSPLAYELYVRLFNLLRNQAGKEWDYAELVDEYLAAGDGWGERVKDRVHLDIGYTLAILEESPDIAREQLDLAAERLSATESEALQNRLQLSEGLLLINSESGEDQQRGLALLKENQEKDPFNLVSVVRMAEYHETHENPEAALELYASLQTVPGIQGDPSKIATLWKDLGRDPQELEAFLDEIYEKTVHQFVDVEADADTEPAPDDQQVVLCELLTGASCPPCVAADIATAGLELAFPTSKVIVLRYHEHVPAPDPLAIADGETRMQYYEARGTPSLYINGTNVQGVGGSIFNASSLYQQLRKMVATLTEQTTDLKVKLTVEGNGGSLHVSAVVEGDEPPLETWRLRLCLVEDSVHYTAPNGIRVHEMLVRHMPGGAEGIIPQEDAFVFDGEITAGDLNDTLLSNIETSKTRYNVDLPEVPVGSEGLHLVAFVQDDLSLEVKQAAIVPVTGFDTTPPEAPAEEAAAADSPESEAEPGNADDAPESSPPDSPESADETSSGEAVEATPETEE